MVINLCVILMALILNLQSGGGCMFLSCLLHQRSCLRFCYKQSNVFSRIANICLSPKWLTLTWNWEMQLLYSAECCLPDMWGTDHLNKLACWQGLISDQEDCTGWCREACWKLLTTTYNLTVWLILQPGMVQAALHWDSFCSYLQMILTE